MYKYVLLTDTISLQLSLLIVSLLDYHRHYRQMSRYIHLAIAGPFLSTKAVSENYAFLFTVSNRDRHRDRNKAIIRVTGADAGRDQPS